ncbi:MAG: type IV pilin protein [Burkholderiales bacterium]|nr:type IV pilin protein [Burkholderiales bacterium]MDE2454161.1 type IV pilin protein [Burkholderiales bacterium]
MIAIAIVAIVGAIAYPSYLKSIAEGRRTEAVSALNQMQQGQERWRANNPLYVPSGSETTLVPSTTTGPGGYYTLSIVASDDSGYIMTATAVAGTSQANDTNCSKMLIAMVKGSISYGGCAAASCTVPALGTALTDPNKCWKR